MAEEREEYCIAAKIARNKRAKNVEKAKTKKQKGSRLAQI